MLMGDETGDGVAVHRTQVRVRYAETDRMGVVYYANYFVWFEVGAHGVAARHRMELPGNGVGRRRRCR